MCKNSTCSCFLPQAFHFERLLAAHLHLRKAFLLLGKHFRLQLAAVRKPASPVVGHQAWRIENVLTSSVLCRVQSWLAGFFIPRVYLNSMFYPKLKSAKKHCCASLPLKVTPDMFSTLRFHYLCRTFGVCCEGICSRGGEHYLLKASRTNTIFCALHW